MAAEPNDSKKKNEKKVVNVYDPISILEDRLETIKEQSLEAGNAIPKLLKSRKQHLENEARFMESVKALCGGVYPDESTITNEYNSPATYLILTQVRHYRALASSVDRETVRISDNLAKYQEAIKKFEEALSLIKPQKKDKKDVA